MTTTAGSVSGGWGTGGYVYWRYVIDRRCKRAANPPALDAWNGCSCALHQWARKPETLAQMARIDARRAAIIAAEWARAPKGAT